MRQLGLELVEQLRRAKHVDRNLVDEFERVAGKVGFEAAVDKVEGLSAHLDLIVQSIHTIVSSGDQSAYENIVLTNKPTPFQELLQNLKSSFARPLVIVSTNYDRIVEYECGRTDIPLFSGFSQSYLGRYDDNNRPSGKPKFCVDIYKVHGSVDWYVRQETQEASFLPLTRSATPQYSPLIVVPGRSKYLAADQGVHRRVKNAADVKFKEAQKILAVGYGFRDPHVHEMLLQRFREKTLNSEIVVLARTLSDEAKDAAKQADRYVLVERADEKTSRVYSDSHDGVTIAGNYWNLDGLMELYR